MIKNTIILVFGILIGYFITGKSCNFDFSGPRYDTIAYKIDTLYKTHDTIIYKKGKDIHHDTTIYVEIPVEVLKNIDTAKILQEFFAINVYKDTLNLKDSLGYISITDSINKNTIIARNWHYQIKEKIINKEVTLREKPKPHIYAGLGMNGFANSLEGSILLQNKKGRILQLGVVKDFNNNATIGKVGLIWKIK